MKLPFYAEVGRPKRMIAARLVEGQDLVDAALELIEANGFSCGTLSALGALKRAVLNSPRSFEFSDPSQVMVSRRIEGPVDVGIAQGVFGRNENGAIDMHFHGVVMDTQGRVYCGDLVPGENPVWCMIELVVTEFDGNSFNPVHNRFSEWRHDQEKKESEIR